MGASVYTVLLLAPGPRSFFINYGAGLSINLNAVVAHIFSLTGMTSSLITVIVAISPTLGQSFRTFLLQLTGTGPSSSLPVLAFSADKLTRTRFSLWPRYPRDLQERRGLRLQSVRIIPQLRRTRRLIVCAPRRYGLTAALALWAGFASWVFYVDAKYYTAGLLLMTGASNVSVVLLLLCCLLT